MKTNAFRVILTLLMALPLLAVSPVITSAQVRTQPALLDLAVQHPDQMVSVIVQKVATDTSVEEATLHLGGKLTRDLHIINAFAASVPAKAVPQLARMSGVRWVSLDSPVTRTGDGSITPVQQNAPSMKPQPSGTPFSDGGNVDPQGSLFDAGTSQSTSWASDLAATSTSSISTGFLANTILPGSYLWFNSVLKVSGVSSSAPTTIYFDHANIQINMLGQQYSLPIPDSKITYDPSAGTASTTYDAVSGNWVTVIPAHLAGNNSFLSGMEVRVPTLVLGVATSVTVSGRFTSDTQGTRVTSWQWSAATYSAFNINYNGIGVKPCDDGNASQWHNSDKAGTPENYKPYVIPGALGLGGNNYTGSYSPSASVTPVRLFNNPDLMVDGARGPNGTYGNGSNATQAFSGFDAERVPGQAITNVEVALQAYVPTQLLSSEDPMVSVSVGGQVVNSFTLQSTAFDTHVGVANAGMIYVDATGNRNWTWGDFDSGVQVTINQSGFSSSHTVYYDAVGLRINSDAGTDSSGGDPPTSGNNNMVDTSVLQNAYPQTVRASDVWNGASGRMLQGQSITVAVVDSGVSTTDDMKGRVITSVNFNHLLHDSSDQYGHGTFVAGIIAGDGKASQGHYVGIAPKTNIMNVRVSGDDGSSNESDVVAGLQWVNDNKARYNVKVVNLSMNASVMESYHNSPLDAAVEILWFDRIVVVVSAGNNGTANLFPPANDPFVITVGATDDQGTTSMSDDTIPAYSAWGVTENGAVKPEIVAPGTHIVSLLPDNSNTEIGLLHGNNRVNANYFKMSGTSMAAPMVSGAVALLLQDEPNLNPDQVKYRLMATAAKTSRWPAYNASKAGSGYLDIYAAITGTTYQTANTGVRASQMLWSGQDPVTWQSVNWSSVNWSSVNWSSVNWSSVNWSSVNWSSDTWEP